MLVVEFDSTRKEVNKHDRTIALRSVIAESGLKYKALAEIMGLSPYTCK